MKKFTFLFIFLLSLIIIVYSLSVKPSPLPPNTKTEVTLFRNTPTPTPQYTTIMAVGDIMLSRKVNLKMIEYDDWKYPFLKTAAFLKTGDIVFGNLESPFTNDCKLFVTGMSFCARKEAIEGINYAGFNLLGLSNNHIYNHGKEGKKFTIDLLAQNGIQYADENHLAIQQFDNTSYGFLMFDLTINNDPKPIFEAITKYSTQVDVLIIGIHWGVEYEPEPRQWQINLAHQFIDKGAKIVLGGHPHVTQPIEEYNEGLIIYSLGNFVFDQMWSEETKKGKIAKIVFDGVNIKSWQEIPVYIIDFAQPQLTGDPQFKP